jgi:ATP-dependent DNA helicase RecQ
MAGTEAAVKLANLRPVTRDAPSDAPSALKQVFGYETFRGFQREAIEHVVAGGDALVLMPTGGGKSLCYQIPALLREGTGIVISPLIALMQDQVAALEELGVRAAFLNSTLTARQASDVIRRLRAGELDLLYVAPERLLMESTQALLDQCRLALFAIDEAHCVSQWGHDFRPEYGQLSLLRERWPQVPRIALTATADVPTRTEIVARLLIEPRRFVASFDRPNIRYRIVEKREPREQLLRLIRDEHAGEAGIVYCLTRSTVEEVAATLAAAGIDALPYHAGISAEERKANQTRFMQADGVVVVATIAFGMGIDKPDVRFVAHLDMPKSVEGYFQETGRAGRDGLPADAWMAYGLQDVVQQRRLIDLSDADDNYKRLSTAKLDAMLGLAEAADCRRVRLLAYFGEASAPCGNCDNCLEPPEVWDATEAARQLLSCIYRCRQASGFAFAATHVIDVLRGKSTEKTRKFGHEKLSTFGIGAATAETQWRVLLRQLVAMKLVDVDSERFNVLTLTDAARPVLKGEVPISVRRHAEKTRARKERAAKTSVRAGAVEATFDANAASTFERLRAWRAEIAKSRGVPAYVIFHDETLRAIAAARPATLAQLRGVSGVGERKLEHYGADVLRLIESN